MKKIVTALCFLISINYLPAAPIKTNPHCNINTLEISYFQGDFFPYFSGACFNSGLNFERYDGKRFLFHIGTYVNWAYVGTGSGDRKFTGIKGDLGLGYVFFRKKAVVSIMHGRTEEHGGWVETTFLGSFPYDAMVLNILDFGFRKNCFQWSQQYLGEYGGLYELGETWSSGKNYDNIFYAGYRFAFNTYKITYKEFYFYIYFLLNILDSKETISYALLDDYTSDSWRVVARDPAKKIEGISPGVEIGLYYLLFNFTFSYMNDYNYRFKIGGTVPIHF